LKEENYMTIEKGRYGQWIISDIVEGYYVHRQYYGYSKKEAIQLFIKEL
jgi:hypothetical protein